jgi:hypothetical protein
MPRDLAGSPARRFLLFSPASRRFGADVSSVEAANPTQPSQAQRLPRVDPALEPRHSALHRRRADSFCRAKRERSPELGYRSDPFGRTREDKNSRDVRRGVNANRRPTRVAGQHQLHQFDRHSLVGCPGPALRRHVAQDILTDERAPRWRSNCYYSGRRSSCVTSPRGCLECRSA